MSSKSRYTLDSVKRAMLEALCNNGFEGHKPLLTKSGDYYTPVDETHFNIFDDHLIVLCAKCRCSVYLDRLNLDINESAILERPTPPWP